MFVVAAILALILSALGVDEAFLLGLLALWQNEAAAQLKRLELRDRRRSDSIARIALDPHPSFRPQSPRRLRPDRFTLYVCRSCGAFDLSPDEITHLSGRCEGRSDPSHIDRVTAEAVKREPCR